MVRFRSAQRRAFWGAVAFSVGCEYAVALAYFLIVSSGNSAAWAWALLAVVAFQILLSVYALFSFGRRALWYHLFERKARAEAIGREFVRYNFPRPEEFYLNADEYLRQVALSPATSPEGALFAGALLGTLEGHRLNGPRSEAFFLSLSIERAMKGMLPWERAAELRGVT